jgi:hypothetical protein
MRLMTQILLDVYLMKLVVLSRRSVRPTRAIEWGKGRRVHWLLLWRQALDHSSLFNFRLQDTVA